jgi:lactoylglutathione lyase
MSDSEAVTGQSGVFELRLAVTVADLDQALAFYRDELGMPQVEAYQDGDARVFVLSAGRATLELFNEAQAELIDNVEVGRRVAPPIRVALEVADSENMTARLEHAGAQVIARPVITPWRHRNARLEGPGNLQLTLFTVL